MRCAMVASGTRYASAICRVVSPPTARSVSATAEAGVSDGWAHRKYSCRVSSESGPCREQAPAPPRPVLPAPAGRPPTARRRDAAARRRSPASLGVPRRLRGPGPDRLDQSILDGILRRREVDAATTEDADHGGDQLPQQLFVHSIVGG